MSARRVNAVISLAMPRINLAGSVRLIDNIPHAVILSPQQKRYSPVAALNRTTLAGLLSSCRQPLNTVTVKLQLAVLPDVSVAVPVTVVVPTERTQLGGILLLSAAQQVNIATDGGQQVKLVCYLDDLP